MKGQHNYKATIRWTGNRGQGTINYTAYARDHIISIENKADISGSSDPAFRGDKTRFNPEELLVSSLSSCHMLWYLHLCAEAGIIVVDYVDNATGVMIETPGGGGHFTEVTLNPVVTVTEARMAEMANGLHKRAGELCFIASSVNFPVFHNPQTITKVNKD